MDQGIKIKAETKEDLKVISALLQDAACKVGDMAFLSNNMRFAFVANRFRWEKEGREIEGREKEDPKKKPAKGKKTHQRIRSGLRFEGVLNAAFQNLPALEKNHVLSLLSLEVKKEKGNFVITLVFSNSISIRLLCEVLEVYLEDITGAWHTRNLPTHPVG